RLERVGEVADLKLLAVERSVLDRQPIVIRLELLLVVEPADGTAVGKDKACLLLTLVLILDRLLTLDDEIGRPPVERKMELRIGHARAVDDRLVGAGQEPAVFAKLGDPHRTEVILEEGARLVALERDGPWHASADVLERGCHRPRVAQLALPVEYLAAGLERRIGGAMIVAR